VCLAHTVAPCVIVNRVGQIIKNHVGRQRVRPTISEIWRLCGCPISFCPNRATLRFASETSSQTLPYKSNVHPSVLYPGNTSDTHVHPPLPRLKARPYHRRRPAVYFAGMDVPELQEADFCRFDEADAESATVVDSGSGEEGTDG